MILYTQSQLENYCFHTLLSSFKYNKPDQNAQRIISICRSHQIQRNFKYKINTFFLMQPCPAIFNGASTQSPSQTRLHPPQRSQSQIKPSNYDQIYKKMLENKSAAPAYINRHINGDSNKGPIKFETVKDNDLSVLERQIEVLEGNHSRQTCLRYEAEAFILRKKRTNLFKAFDRNFSSMHQNNKNGAIMHFNTQISQKKPGNKNSIKLYKVIRSFFQSGRPTGQNQHRFLSFISYKHKYTLPENSKIEENEHYFSESDIRRIKKYQNNINNLPPLGVQFDYINKDDGDETDKNTVNPQDYYQEDINCFEERPAVFGYQLSDGDFFREFLNRSKKQLFKGAKLLSRLRVEKQAVLKRLAYLCMKEVDKRYKKCLKNQSDYINRAKKIHRQGLLYWRKRDKDLAELKKKKEKIENEIKKRNEEKQEEETQKKKLQYLMKQSSLYSHFMAKKLGMESENKDLGPNQSQKPIQIDQQAAQLNVNQIISKKMHELQQYDGPSQANDLDFSKVDLQQEGAQITGPPPIFHGKLKDYQVKGLKWLYNLNLQGINGILADQMGLGKTIQAIALLSHISYTQNKWGPFLIVSPSSTLHNWQQQFRRFCPSLKILPYWGGIKQRKVIRKNFSTKKFTSKHDSPFHVVITSYQMAVTDEKTFKRLKWQFIVLDEAHNIKNTMSQRWNVLKEFQSRSRLLLTGTPIQNNMAELWALLNFIMPQLFDSHEQFNQWFSKDIEAHSQDQKELDKIQIQRLHAILKPFMLRRVKKDVQHEIGRKFETRLLCQMTKRQKLLYDSIKQKLNVKELFKMIESKTKVQNLMNLVMQLRKVCNHPQLFERRPPLSPFMFQEVYYYTGFTPIRSGEIKLISFSSVNPISYNLPKLIYEDLIRYPENINKRNKRILNLFSVQNMKTISSLQSLGLIGLSWKQLQVCFRQDLLFTKILLLHWFSKGNYTPKLSTKQYLYSSPISYEKFKINPEAQFVKQWSEIYIPTAIAPTIQANVSTGAYYNEQEEFSNNKFQRFIFQGRYKQKWGHKLQDQQFDGILPKSLFLTKIELVNFGSLVADSAKLTQLDRILKEKRKNGDKVLIFCQMTKMLDILEDFMNMRKYPFFRLDGACSLSDRRDMVNEFQRQNSKVFVFLLSTRAGGLGVTLTAANNVVFYDNDWNPTMDAQATDRAHRIGQTRDVFVYQLVTKNTIEDRIVKRAQQKKTVQSTVYQGGSLNIFKKDIMQLMADELGVEAGEQIKKDDQNQAMKRRGPKPVKPTIGKTRDKQKAF